MPSVAALSIYIYGLFTSLAGTYNIIFSSNTAPIDPVLPLSVVEAIYVAAIASGAYSLLAAWQENRAFFWAKVAVGALTATVLGRHARDGEGLDIWGTVAVWEGAAAATTGVCLFWEGMGRWARSGRDARNTAYSN